MPSSGGGRGLLSDLGGARRRRSGGRWTGGAPALDSDVPEEGNLRLAVNPEQDPDLQLIIKAVRRSTHTRVGARMLFTWTRTSERPLMRNSLKINHFRIKVNAQRAP